MTPVKWSQAHLDELERIFPEELDQLDTNKLLLNSGKRAVVHYVKNRIKAQEKRVSHGH